MFVLLLLLRSSSVDTPVETIASSVTLHEDVDVKETAADVTEEKVEEPPTPAIAQPAHTSPELSFASEVKSQNMIYRSKYMHITITFNSNRDYQSNIK